MFSYFVFNLIISLLSSPSCQHLKVIILMGITCLTVFLFVRTSKHLSLIYHCQTAQVKGQRTQWRRCSAQFCLQFSVSLNESLNNSRDFFFRECVWIFSAGQEQCLQLSQQSLSVCVEQCGSYLFFIEISQPFLYIFCSIIEHINSVLEHLIWLSLEADRRCCF